MSKLDIQYLDPKTLIPYANNHKVHSEDQINRLASIIAEFGFDQPIVVDKDMVIGKGHCRREAAIKLRMKLVPVIVNDMLDEYQFKAMRIADNKISSTDYNYDALKFDIGTLSIRDFNLDLTGLTSSDLEALKINEIDLSDEKFDLINRSIENQEKHSALNSTDIDVYSDKITTPIYEPNGEKPSLTELVDLMKYKSLCNEIDRSDLSNEEKELLKLAASRHIVFNYENIANYYAHSDKTVQGLFENSALVIIDFDKAVENGFVKLSKEMNEGYINNGDDDEND